jgi:hypothetical protein
LVPAPAFRQLAKRKSFISPEMIYWAAAQRPPRLALLFPGYSTPCTLCTKNKINVLSCFAPSTDVVPAPPARYVTTVAIDGVLGGGAAPSPCPSLGPLPWLVDALQLHSLQS